MSTAANGITATSQDLCVKQEKDMCSCKTAVWQVQRGLNSHAPVPFSRSLLQTQTAPPYVVTLTADGKDKDQELIIEFSNMDAKNALDRRNFGRVMVTET